MMLYSGLEAVSDCHVHTKNAQLACKLTVIEILFNKERVSVYSD